MTVEQAQRPAPAGRTTRQAPAPAAGAAAPAVARPAPPRWLAVTEAVHGAAPTVATVAFDAAIVGAVAWSVHGVRRGGTQAATVFVVAAFLTGLYRRRSPVEAVGVHWYALRVLPATVAVLALACVAPPVVRGRAVVAMAMGSAAACAAALVAVRAALWALIAWARRDLGFGLRRTLLVGGPAGIAYVRAVLDRHPEFGLACTASYEAAPADATLRGPAADRGRELFASGAVDQVLVASGDGAEAAMGACLSWAVPGVPPHAVVIPRRRLGRDLLRHRMGELAVLPLPELHGLAARRPGKRFLDVAGGLVLLLGSLPALALIAVAVAALDGRPVTYRQPRVGRGGRLFTIVKFRSMAVGADRRMADYAHRNACTGLLFKLEHDPRVSRLGAALRRLAVDELPQLLNVLRGDMSLVGPRPLPVDPCRFSPVAALRHAAPPGVTGAWQVEGGNSLTYDEMVQLDLAYLASWSLARDLWLLARTPLALLRRRGPC